MSLTTPPTINDQLEAALQQVERIIALVRHTAAQDRLPAADAEKILAAAETFAASTLF